MAEPNIKDIAYRTAANVFGGPVDLATMVMRPFGYNTPDTQVVGGSEWIGKKMEDAGLASSARAPLTEFIASMAVPTPGVLAKGTAFAAPAIAGMFIGKGAKTWDALAAQKAKMLADIGTDARTIWQQTGTWKGPDGKWRQEVGDQSAKLTLGRGSPDEYAAKFPQDEALKLAQQRATLPVEKGGLGLGPNNTAEERAAAMGFDTPAYHTSRTGVDTDVLDSGKYAMAPFDSIGTHFGTKEAALDRFNRTVGTTDQIKGSSYPVLLKGDKPLMSPSGAMYTEDPLAMMLSAKSDYGNLPKSNANLRQEIFADNSIIPYINDVEAAGSTSYIAPPDSIRSRFAAFDPFRKDVATAIAMGVAAPNLLAQEQPIISEAEQRARIMFDTGQDPYTIYQQTGIWLGGNE